MGQCLTSNPEVAEAARRNKIIDIQIKKDRKELDREVKMLLLGKCFLSLCVFHGD